MCARRYLCLLCSAWKKCRVYMINIARFLHYGSLGCRPDRRRSMIELLTIRGMRVGVFFRFSLSVVLVDGLEVVRVCGTTALKRTSSSQKQNTEKKHHIRAENES